jgi:hypothetical protein
MAGSKRSKTKSRPIAKSKSKSKPTSAKSKPVSKKPAKSKPTSAKSKPAKSKSTPAKSEPAKSKSTSAKSKSASQPKSASKKPASNLEGYLRDWREYRVTEVRRAKCRCGADVFEVQLDDEAGGAKRTCVGCEREHLLCDSAEYWDEAEPDECACPCGNETFRLAAGFAFYEDPKGVPTQDVRWIYIALQCVKCDLIGVYGDWKIDYSPSHQLLDQV